MRWFNFKSLMLLLSCTASHQGAKTNKEKGKCRSEFTTRLLAAYQWQLVPLFWHRVTSHSCTFPTDSCQFSWQSSEPQRKHRNEVFDAACKDSHTPPLFTHRCWCQRTVHDRTSVELLRWKQTNWLQQTFLWKPSMCTSLFTRWKAIKVIRVLPLRNMNICTESHPNSSHHSWDVGVATITRDSS